MSDNQVPGSDFLETLLFSPAANDGDEPANPDQGAEQPDGDQQPIDETDEVDAEGQSDETDESGDDSAPQLYKIKAAGEEHELDLDGLITAAQKGIGYETNVNKLAREHKAEMALLTQERATLDQELTRVGDYLEVFGESEKAKQHLEYLQEYDLPEFKRITALNDEIKTKVAEVKKQRADEFIAASIETLAQSFGDEWADVKTRKNLLDTGAKFFTGLGLSVDEINQICTGPGSGAAYVAAIKAQQYDELMAKTAEARKNPPKNQIKKLPTVSAKIPTPAKSSASPMASLLGWSPK